MLFDSEDWEGVGKETGARLGCFQGESFGTEVEKLIYSFASVRECFETEEASISTHWLRADGNLI